jgi:hypothetical protein
MENNSFLQVLLYFIPAALILMTCYLLIKQFLTNEHKIKLIELKKASNKEVFPLRLQAYERMILFLERISPNNLVQRVSKPGMTARELQVQLLTAIRNEYEHNLSQQLFISSQAWELVRNAKEDMVKIINIAMSKLSEKNLAIDLSKAIFEIILKTEVMPAQKAIEYLKKEFRQLYI